MPWISGFKEFDDEAKHKRNGGILTYGNGEMGFCAKLIASILGPITRMMSSIVMMPQTQVDAIGPILLEWSKRQKALKGHVISAGPQFNLSSYNDHAITGLKVLLAANKPGVVVIQLAEDNVSGKEYEKWYTNVSQLQDYIDFHFILAVPRPVNWTVERQANYIVGAKAESPAFTKIKSRYGGASPISTWQELEVEEGLYVPSVASMSSSDLNAELYDLANATLDERIANKPRLDRLLKEWRKRPENANRQQPLFM